ncbi:UDP-N-acetylglucosamine 1-carboxyvinyltransferase [Cellulosilyticum lentocellum]|uniref:UDP-N-acetylglucosamine 1-carboxyvinyltransferase n=1 Tax=Cellulosilyticum lentocellum (strain ATCC 49066 / DSM 5427 / NCIMB 11756 / RHM5) TaxID=642492 RepID=F2JSA0_CELLD|nr:UDP-N-acetylglucosamine 1-carboxyvinyltransferase [Cellulosilyticum lentocellum]ADZ84037.1 UDP-N-acetylglucosamine 1-carboxyvinyltransferase [Cellulosilyticum lentocellum DSM 5427]
MSKYVIHGGKRLEGELCIDGSKNAVLPIIAATLLSGNITYLQHCPRILDVEIMIEILKQLGCKVEWEQENLMIHTSTLQNCDISEELVKKMRSSIILLGALIGRCGEARISQPGGCQLGARPIDLHLSALKQMGVHITEQQDTIICKSSNLHGAEISLALPSVGATENIMLAATLAQGNTTIYNAAKEPEIVDLQDFLVACGANITGAGTEMIKIQGVKKLGGVNYRVIPDRIIAGTYLVAAAITRGNITLKDIRIEHLDTIIKKLEEVGCHIKASSNEVSLMAPTHLKGIELITEPYPGYPTDMQSQMMALLCTCESPSRIKENLFEARFKPAYELMKMGAKIHVEDNEAYIMPTHLMGAKVNATDLRGGAALVLAGLAAEGYSIVNQIHYIKRGYQNIVTDLSSLGAQIQEKE